MLSPPSASILARAFHKWTHVAALTDAFEMDDDDD